jgi:hypothetical protein
MITITSDRVSGRGVMVRETMPFRKASHGTNGIIIQHFVYLADMAELVNVYMRLRNEYGALVMKRLEELGATVSKQEAE